MARRRPERRVSAPTAGGAVSATAPSTQNVWCRPPASATGGAAPPCSSALVSLAATLEAIAVPMAAPNWVDVFRSPEASPD
jgi:hypothetical protein